MRMGGGVVSALGTSKRGRAQAAATPGVQGGSRTSSHVCMAMVTSAFFSRWKATSFWKSMLYTAEPERMT
jgi:hypothetical protein